MDKADTHADLRQAVQRICADFPDEYWRERELRHEFPWDFYRAFADAGWVGIAIPAEFGGGGAGITEASIMLEEIAASGACLNGCSSIHLSIFGMNPVAIHGSDAMKRQYLPASPRATCTSRSASPSQMPVPTRPTSRHGPRR
jgi:acyl-CoA dehydrogenase